ncbi:MAG: DUF429 domain-containing protein [Proteobacteria bacterium]|nr:DUF429 domain-containing protein [Pseudomonadota bacterium]
MPPRDYDTFIGVDLGGGKGKNTAVAVLERDGLVARAGFVGLRDGSGTPFYDEPLLAFIRQRKARAVLALDAPLTLPACLRCHRDCCPGREQCPDPAVSWLRHGGVAALPSVMSPPPRRGLASIAGGKPSTTPYTQRACELLLARELGIVPRETLGQGTGPLTARAYHLRRALAPHFALDTNLIEVCPKATLHVLFGARQAERYKRHVDTWRARAEMLEMLADRLRFEIWREGVLSNDHCFDALVAAYTGYLWAVEGWEVPADRLPLSREDGWIWWPPPAQPTGR